MTDNDVRPRCATGRLMAARAAEHEAPTYSPVTAENVADYILTAFDGGPDHHITITRLQGLLFRAQGHYLAQHGVPLFPEEIHKINFMPAVPEIEARYRAESEQSREQSGKYSHCFPVNKDVRFPEEIITFLGGIWRTYATHRETITGLYMKVGENHWQSAYYPAGVMDIEVIWKQFSTPYEPITDR